MFWWGDYSVSTEHMVYLNLKNVIPAPRSDSAEMNGLTIAEKIDGQIFIDTWGLIFRGILPTPPRMRQLRQAFHMTKTAFMGRLLFRLVLLRLL